jgi:carbamoyl-phosphate synthase large subunit
MGGQTPNSLAMRLLRNNINILGTDPLSIDKAEDRKKFSSLLDFIKIEQPEWEELSSQEEAEMVKILIQTPTQIHPIFVPLF